MIECKLNEIERKKYKWRKKVFAQQLRKPHSKLHVKLYQREFTSNSIIKQHWVLKMIFHDKHDPLLSMGRWTINLAIPLFFLYMQRSPYIIAYETYTIRTCYCGWREKKHPCNNKSNKELLQNWAKNCENIWKRDYMICVYFFACCSNIDVCRNRFASPWHNVPLAEKKKWFEYANIRSLKIATSFVIRLGANVHVCVCAMLNAPTSARKCIHI